MANDSFSVCPYLHSVRISACEANAIDNHFSKLSAPTGVSASGLIVQGYYTTGCDLKSFLSNSDASCWLFVQVH